MEEENENMSFLGHLEELRWRLVKAVIAIVIVGCVIFFRLMLSLFSYGQIEFKSYLRK